MKIVRYNEPDELRAREVAELFHRAVHAVDPSLYSEKEKDAWAPTPPDYEAWKLRLQQARPYLLYLPDSAMKESLAGFMSVDHKGYIQFAYVAPEFQRLGAGRRLYSLIEEEARAASLETLSVHASKAAVPFFHSLGFKIVRENRVSINEELLTNYYMEKRI